MHNNLHTNSTKIIMDARKQNPSKMYQYAESAMNEYNCFYPTDKMFTIGWKSENSHELYCIIFHLVIHKTCPPCLEA